MVTPSGRRTRKRLHWVALPALRGRRGALGLRNPCWPPPSLGFPFPHRRDRGLAGQWRHHNIAPDNNKRPLACVCSFLCSQGFSLQVASRARQRRSGVPYLSAYFETPPTPLPPPVLCPGLANPYPHGQGLRQSQPLTLFEV